MNPFALPVRRPVATSMFFLGIVLLGLIAWRQIPVELIPPIEGNRLTVSFLRPGSEPEIVEREILLPLAARASELPDVEETEGSIRGPGGTFTVRFEADSDIKVRELELRRVASDLARRQPQGTFIDVSNNNLSVASRFVMVISAHGREDLDVLRRLIEDRVEPRLASVGDVSQVVVLGGSPREVTVRIDPDRCAAVGISPDEVMGSLQRVVGRQRYLGGIEDERGRTAVVLDGRMTGVFALGETRVRPGLPVLLRHVAEIDEATARRQTVSRVDGKPSLALIVFQEEGANLVRLGRALHRRVEELNAEFAPYGLGLTVSFDASELVQERLDRLKQLGASGFLIALVVLFLFLRQWRAVAVVGVAVPVSLLAALALLFVVGQSLNLITIFGLAVGIGMLVDNSIVVYEAVQRRLEHGAVADHAAEEGVRRTVRAILAASITTAVVFLPITFLEFEQAEFKSFLEIMVLAVLLPLAGSLVVAVGLVPLLARHLAAPAALARIARIRLRREELGGLHPPDRARELFGGFLIVALRRPAGWLTVVALAVVLTVVIALPWVAFSSLTREAPEANPVQFSVELPSDATLDKAVAILDRLEQQVRRVDGVERVESFLQENNALVNGSLTVYMLPKHERPAGVDAARIRGMVRAAAKEVDGLEVRNPGEAGGEGDSGGGGGGNLASLLGGGQDEVVLSGPDAGLLGRLAGDVQRQLESVPEIETASRSGRAGQEEVWVVPDEASLAAFRLTANQVLPALGVLRREGVEMRVGFTTRDGEEIPLTVRREADTGNIARRLGELRMATPAGILPVRSVAAVRKMPASPTIQHKNGRRELSVFYRYGSQAPQTGPARQALEQQVTQAIQAVHRPTGYTIETPAGDPSRDWFKRILVPVVLLLFAVLAVTFESLTLPLLVLVSLPLTALGATWSLVLTGTPADPMALVGVVALIGLTVNPAILLVDRMQQRVRGGQDLAGAAALAAVRERARPVLMTTATTVAGLWPLAIVTGRENEIWLPFATVVMGGLITSTLLTLLVIPVGFVMLHRLDRLFGRVGPWIMIGWVGATAAVMTPLIAAGLITSMTWKILTTVLVAALLMGVVVLVLRRPDRPEPVAPEDGPPPLDVRYLKKVYGKPGPIAAAWRLPELFAQRVLARGGRPFDPVDARERIAPLGLLALGAGYLTQAVGSSFWQLMFLLATTVFAVAMLNEVRRARGKVDRMGRALPGGVEGVLGGLLPAVAMTYFAMSSWVLPMLAEERPAFRLWFVIAVTVLVLIVQQGRRTAVRISRGDLRVSPEDLRFRRTRGMWRRFSRRVFGLDLPRQEVVALSRIHFRAERGMIGILGPNGAGKTTLLRQLAGILEPSLGRIDVGGVPLGKLRRYLARYVGYLPQDFGLPVNLTAREYLEYYALLYEIKPAERRRERVDRLLTEVGLGERADERIGSYSGGMRQRVAVARTLLRLPPVIIVDEPTVGLDPRERIRFRNLLSRLAEGRVVLFSTHVVEDVAVACPRVIVLSRGRMVFDGPPAELAEQAAGGVWTVTLSAEEETRLPDDASVVDHVPQPDGRARMRVICPHRPHETAQPATPSLEDGYLMLTFTGGSVG